MVYPAGNRPPKQAASGSEKKDPLANRVFGYQTPPGADVIDGETGEVIHRDPVSPYVRESQTTEKDHAEGLEGVSGNAVPSDTGTSSENVRDGAVEESHPRKRKKEKKNKQPNVTASTPEAVNDNAQEDTETRSTQTLRAEAPAPELDSTLSHAFDNADTIIAFFEDRKELRHVREVFESARERYLNAGDEDEAEALLAYEQAQDDVQHAILEMLNAGAGYHNNVDRNPALYTKGKVQEVFARDFIETKERRAREAGERGPTGDREIDALLKNFKGEFGVLEQQFAYARKAYLDATKKKRDKINPDEPAQNIRLSGKEARLRDAYLSARNDLLFALSNMTRAGAGYTKTDAERKRAQEKPEEGSRREEVSTEKVLEVLIDHEQGKLGEDDESTLETYGLLEREIYNEIKRPTKIPFTKKFPEREASKRQEKGERDNRLSAFGEMVGKKREEYQKTRTNRVQKGLSSKRGFFSSLFSFVFGTPGRRRR